MAAAEDDSVVFIPFMPSLLHLSLVKVGTKLIYDFHMETLNKVFTEILPDYSPGFNEGSKEKLQEAYVRAEETRSKWPKKEGEYLWMRMVLRAMDLKYSAGNQETLESNYIRAKENILCIPEFLRSRVLETVLGLYCSIQNWRYRHRDILKIEDIKVFCFRSDGLIDGFQTAQQIVLNANINLKERFHLACAYCLEESIQTLWAELEASGETSVENIARFWIDRLREGSLVPWVQAIPEYFSLKLRHGIISRFSSFLPLLGQCERMMFIRRINKISLHELQFCLRDMSKDERDFIIQYHAPEFLALYLNWPLRSLFIETANRLWEYMRDSKFLILLRRIFTYKSTRKDFDYSKLFVELWGITPNHLKEFAEEHSYFKEEIDSCLNERRNK